MVKKTSQEVGIEAAPRRYKDIVDREIVRDKRLSLRALGVAVRLLSNAPGFRMTSIDLAFERKEGRDAVRAALRELEAVGYLQRFIGQLENGQWITRQVISDVLPPTPENPTPVPTPEEPTSGSPSIGMQGVKSRKSNISEISISRNATTTTSHELIWPASLDEWQVVVVETVIEGLELQEQQLLLDELAGAIRAGTPPRKLASWVRALRARMERGEFTLDAGLPVAQERARRAAEEEERQHKAEEQRRKYALRNTPEAKARSEAARKEAQQKIDSIFHPGQEIK